MEIYYRLKQQEKEQQKKKPLSLLYIDKDPYE